MSCAKQFGYAVLCRGFGVSRFNIHVHVSYIVFHFHLDLSFNNIKEICGLDSLVNLRDLSLAHNLIQHISGLNSLVKLQILSLGYNALNDLKKTVLYLRQMPSLETLCLKGNEFSPVPPHDEEKGEAEVFRSYQMFSLAYLPDLIYLDYQMITDEAVSSVDRACESAFACTCMCVLSSSQKSYSRVQTYSIHVHYTEVFAFIYMYIIIGHAGTGGEGENRQRDTGCPPSPVFLHRIISSLCAYIRVWWLVSPYIKSSSCSYCMHIIMLYVDVR